MRKDQSLTKTIVLGSWEKSSHEKERCVRQVRERGGGEWVSVRERGGGQRERGGGGQREREQERERLVEQRDHSPHPRAYASASSVGPFEGGAETSVATSEAYH
jgi:hypothetical protein